MNTSSISAPEAIQHAYDQVASVVSIIDKLHGEGFLASRVYSNLGLSKVRDVLAAAVEVQKVVQLEAFAREMMRLFETKALLHPSATPRFQVLFRGYLEAAVGVCAQVTGSDLTPPEGTTLH